MPYSEGEAVFFKNLRATLKYGLHWDAVISRWAREHANEVGALDVTKKIATYTNISQFLFTFSISRINRVLSIWHAHAEINDFWSPFGLLFFVN